MAEHIIERWLPVLGFEGLYSVSSHGRVRREMGLGPRHPAGIVRQAVDRLGYARVSIYARPGVRRSESVHRLVAQSFIVGGPLYRWLDNSEYPKCVNHIDGNPSNNHLDNLEYVTKKQDQLHKHYVLGCPFDRWPESLKERYGHVAGVVGK